MIFVLIVVIPFVIDVVEWFPTLFLRRRSDITATFNGNRFPGQSAESLWAGMSSPCESYLRIASRIACCPAASCSPTHTFSTLPFPSTRISVGVPET
jgi:hypothetical protein